MKNWECYEKKLEVIRAIEDDKIKTPHNIPVGIYTQEAENIYIWAKADKEYGDRRKFGYKEKRRENESEE